MVHSATYKMPHYIGITPNPRVDLGTLQTGNCIMNNYACLIMNTIYNIYIKIPSSHQCIMFNHERKVLKLWCSEDMMRVMALANKGMTVSEAARSYIKNKIG